MSQLQFIYKTLHFHVGYKMVKNLTSRNLPHFLFREKNRIRKFREKSRYQIPNIFGQILRMDSIKYRYMLRYGISFEIFTNCGTFKYKISMTMAIGMNSYKIGQSYIF